MGGKGQRRREKNFRAAHGGDSRLPPAPSLKEIDAIPSKLRKLMELKNISFSSAKPGPASIAKETVNEKRKQESAVEKKKKVNTKVEPFPDSGSTIIRDGNQEMKNKLVDGEDAITTPAVVNDKNKKRKRKAVKDLRFEELDKAAGVSRKKKRKEFLAAKKKKNKKPKTDNVLDFPGHEKIKFGEIVEAPPKLTVPKKRSTTTKNPLDAFHVRVRLEAIEAYRNQRGWTSRPGVQIPMPENPSS